MKKETTLIIGVVVVLIMMSSASAAFMLMGGEESGTMGPGPAGPSSTRQVAPTSKPTGTINYIVTADGHHFPGAMLYMGDTSLATWKYWKDPKTKWKVIPTGSENEYWIVTDETHHNPGKTIYVENSGEYGILTIADFNYDNDKKWKFIPGPNEGEFQIVSSSGQPRPNIMLNSSVHASNPSAGSVWLWSYYTNPAAMWKLIEA